MKQANQKYTILYARLSQEDDREGESNSIQNQRMMLEKYAADNGFENTLFLSDDGYSGTNFNRPGWNELMRLVENDKVATIIEGHVRGLGKLLCCRTVHTRDGITPSYGIRFIACQQQCGQPYGDNDFTPFKNCSMISMPRYQPEDPCG
jgi:DNA invertase Pin-like site-specific DNA recombinase